MIVKHFLFRSFRQKKWVKLDDKKRLMRFQKVKNLFFIMLFVILLT